jgi:hypothetical protein
MKLILLITEDRVLNNRFELNRFKTKGIFRHFKKIQVMEDLFPNHLNQDYSLTEVVLIVPIRCPKGSC